MNTVESALEHFEACARDFRDWCIEQTKTELPANDLLIRLVDLYQAALQLPQNGGNLEEDCEVEIPRHKFPIASLPFDYYWEIFDPFVDLKSAKNEVVTGSLADDIKDILQDLSEGFAYWDAGRKDLAHWKWQVNFTGHWSEHASGAIRALDRYMANY